jgi:ATP-dependent DNA helicase RecG
MAYPPLHPESRSAPTSFTRTAFQRLYGAESDYVEFKTGTGNQPLQDAIVAFSNADGGVIFIGVRDDASIAGRELNQGTHDAIVQAFRDTRDPGRYVIRALDVEGTSVVAVSVARRVNGFAQTSNGRVLARRGTHKVALFGDELRHLLVDRSLERFEDHDSGVALSEASTDRLRRLAEIYGWEQEFDDGRLRERGLLRRDSRRLTIAGAAYLIPDPSPVLGKAYIEVLRFPSADAEYDRRDEIRGSLDYQVSAATKFVAAELGHELVVLGLQRHEIPKLPLVVLREAIANAVAHRSYEMNGTAIRIEMRPDEVRIISPGGLPEPVTEENIRDAQAARNHNIIRVLRHAGLAEDAGRGIDVMVDSMRSELLDAPQFRDLGHAVEVSLPVRSAVTPAERAWVREIEARGLIQPTDRLILVHAARGERLTNGRVRELLGLDSADARLALRRLKEAQLLVQHGTRGGATYVLADSIAAPAGLRLTPVQLGEVLEGMAREEPLTNAKVRLRTGLERAEALRVLDDLVSAGKLIRIGERRGTRYELPPSSGNDAI